jgi:DCN1-like protein 1/2
MDMAATQQYFKDIGVELTDVTSFIASHIVQCPSVGEITKDGFVTGWSELKCDTIAKQKAQIATFRSMIGDSERTGLLDKVYKHTFKMVLSNPGQRILEKETCMDMWRIFLVPPSFDWSTPRTLWLDIWLKFVEERSSTKGINADLWNQVLKFAKASVADDTLGFWNEEQSWPALIDEFVAYVKETRRSGAAGESEAMEFA